MHAIRRILVAIKNPEARSLPAVAKAARLAHATGAQLELFHGIAEPVSADAYLYMEGGVVQHERATRAHYLERLETLANRLRREGLKVSIAAEWDFPIYEAIVRRARRIKADLIVAECHAGRRLAPWLLHLTDWELLRTSPVPVLLVKSPRPWRKQTVLAALDPTHAFAKPAALDEQILKAAASVAAALRAPLDVMHAFIPLPTGSLPFDGASGDVVRQIIEASQARAKTSFAHALRNTKIPRARRHLVEGLPAEAIPRMARKLHSSIVVMGAVSRSGLKRLFIGNTAERILNELTCDVLVVKPARFPSRVSRSGRGVHYVGLPQVPMPY